LATENAPECEMRLRKAFTIAILRKHNPKYTEKSDVSISL